MINVDLDKMVATEAAYLEQTKIIHQKKMASFMEKSFAKDFEPTLQWMQLVNNHLAVTSDHLASISERLERLDNANS